MLAHARVWIESFIGQFKRKYPVNRCRMEYEPEMACKIILATATLWNYGILTGDNAGYNPETEDVPIPDIFDVDARQPDDPAGAERRELVARQMWAARYGVRPPAAGGRVRGRGRGRGRGRVPGRGRGRGRGSQANNWSV